MDVVNEDRTGRWAWVAGASEGLGRAFAEELAARGYDLVLIARRDALLTQVATDLQARFGVRTLTHAADLAAESLARALEAWVNEAPPAVAIYNAAYAPVGAFIDQDEADLLRVVDVNVRGPLLFSRILGRHMASRGAGALVLISSLAGLQGSPRLASYAASKAFNTVLAESLWHELGAHGVQVHVCCAGAVRTPGYAAASSSDAPGTLDAAVVARKTLDRIGGGPRIVPGWVNSLAALVVGRWLPRRSAIRIMAGATGDLEE